MTKEEEIEVCETVNEHPDVVKNLKDEMLSDEEFTRLGNLYKIFSDPMRIKIIFALFENEMCVCDLSAALGATQSNVSHHLAILKANDLVTYKKQGKEVIYRLSDDHVKKIFAMGLEHIREK